MGFAGGIARARLGHDPPAGIVIAVDIDLARRVRHRDRCVVGVGVALAVARSAASVTQAGAPVPVAEWLAEAITGGGAAVAAVVSTIMLISGTDRRAMANSPGRSTKSASIVSGRSGTDQETHRNFAGSLGSAARRCSATPPREKTCPIGKIGESVVDVTAHDTFWRSR